MDTADKILVSVILTVLIVLICIRSYQSGKETTQKEAVKNGVARWEATVTDEGEVNLQFKWNVPVEKNKK